MFWYKITILISTLLMSCVAPLYSFYNDKNYGKCQIVDYTFDKYPFIYRTVIVNMKYDRGNIAQETDII